MSTDNCWRCRFDVTRPAGNHVCHFEGDDEVERRIPAWASANCRGPDDMPPTDTPSPCPGFAPCEPVGGVSETERTAPAPTDALAEALPHEFVTANAHGWRECSHCKMPLNPLDDEPTDECRVRLRSLASRLRADLNDAQDTVRQLHSERADLVRASSGKMPTGPENATWSLARQVYEDRLALAAYAADAAKARKLAADGAPHEDIRAALRSHGPYAVAGAIDGVDNVHDIVKDCARLRANRDDAIRVWRFGQAPPALRELSSHGGDEDWLALVPPAYVGDWIGWMDDGSAFGCSSVSEHALPDGAVVRIGAHS